MQEQGVPLPDKQRTNLVITVIGKKGSGKSHLIKTQIIPKFRRVIIIDALCEYQYYAVESVADFYDFMQANYERDFFRVAYRPHSEHAEGQFFKICAALEDVLIVIEESDLYCSATAIDPYIRHMVRYGRHKRQNLVFVSRRMAALSREMTSQSNILLTFEQTEVIDLKHFSALGVKPERFQALKKYEFMVIPGEEEWNLFLQNQK
jgi:hypothetical protein